MRARRTSAQKAQNIVAAICPARRALHGRRPFSIKDSKADGKAISLSGGRKQCKSNIVRYRNRTRAILFVSAADFCVLRERESRKAVWVSLLRLWQNGGTFYAICARPNKCNCRQPIFGVALNRSIVWTWLFVRCAWWGNKQSQWLK